MQGSIFLLEVELFPHPLGITVLNFLPGGERFFSVFHHKLAIIATNSLILPYFESFCITLIVIFNLQSFSHFATFFPRARGVFPPKSQPKKVCFGGRKFFVFWGVKWRILVSKKDQKPSPLRDCFEIFKAFLMGHMMLILRKKI